MTYYDDFLVEAGNTYTVTSASDDGNEKVEWLCEEFWVDTKIVDLQSNTQELVVAIKIDGETILTEPIPRGRLMKSPIPELSEYGLSVAVTPVYNTTVAEILIETEKNAPVQYQHKVLGFARLPSTGEQVFLGHKPIGPVPPHRVDSTYSKPDKVLPRGTLESYKQVLQEEVAGRLNLILALAIAVTPLLLYLLRNAGVLYDLPIFVFVGPSSTGKTTALRLIASVYGLPIERSGLIGDFNATLKALTARFAGMQGMPLILDEATSADIDFKRLVLALSTGYDRERCRSDGSVEDAASFCGSFIISSEHSLFEDDYGESGATARVVELNLPWTDDADHARSLEQKLLENCGTAVKPLVVQLLKRHDKLPGYFKTALNYLGKKNFARSSVEGRKLKVYALILVAAMFVKIILGVDIGYTQLTELIIAQHETHRPPEEETDKVARLYETIKTYVTHNRGSFTRDTPSRQSNGPFWNTRGELSKQDGISCAWIPKDDLDKLIKDFGFLKPVEARQKLAERGWLFRTKDRHYWLPHTFGDTGKMDAYCVLLPDS